MELKHVKHANNLLKTEGKEAALAYVMENEENVLKEWQGLTEQITEMFNDLAPAVQVMTDAFGRAIRAAELIGVLTGWRCPDCGCSLFKNSAGQAWCSECDYQTEVFEATNYVWVPTPCHIVDRYAQMGNDDGDDTGRCS